MPLKLEIPDNQLETLKEYYKVVYENFKIKAQPILDEWKEIQPILNQLGIITNDLLGDDRTKSNIKTSYSSSDAKDTSAFNKSWSWLEKSEYIIKKRGTALTPREIIKQLVEVYEPDIDEKLAKNSVPATLSVAAKQGKIMRTKNEKEEYVYV